MGLMRKQVNHSSSVQKGSLVNQLGWWEFQVQETNVSSNWEKKEQYAKDSMNTQELHSLTVKKDSLANTLG